MPGQRFFPRAALVGLVLVLASLPAAWAQDATAPDAAPDAAATLAPDAPGGAAATLADTAAVPPGATASSSSVDFVEWDRVAVRAEQALEAARASDQAFQALRGELVSWREIFTKARAENQVRINTLRTQINALGPAPAEGETEPVAITETRAALNAQLEEAQAPVKAAEVALARANSLIAQTDSTLRARQTDALLSLGPTPLNPAFWRKSVEDFLATMSFAWRGVTNSFSTETQRADLWKNLPFALLFGMAALVLCCVAELGSSGPARR